MFKGYFALFVSVIFMALFSLPAHARTQVDLSIAIPTAPPPPPVNVVMMPPQGYSNCYMTPGNWMGNAWIPPHQECEYPSPSGVAMWESGYWGCVAVGPGGGCGRWKWFGHHWIRGREVAYYHHVRHHERREYW